MYIFFVLLFFHQWKSWKFTIPGGVGDAHFIINVIPNFAGLNKIANIEKLRKPYSYEKYYSISR